MHIDIDLPRPVATFLFVAAVSGWGMVWAQSDDQAVLPPAGQVITAPALVTEHVHEDVPAKTPASAFAANVSWEDEEAGSQPQGGDPLSDQILQAEDRSRQARAEQQILATKEKILRDQLDVLQRERASLGDKVDPALDRQFRESMQLLVSFMQDQQKADEFLLTSVQQIWEAEGRTKVIGRETSGTNRSVAFDWPVDGHEITAHFLDADYEERFRMKHYAIDIRSPQGSPVYAAASGIVKDVVDHGLGFSYVTVQHQNGYSTLYGHLSVLRVQPGQVVAMGDLLGDSGGLPGTSGAGFSTGPHLHFGLYKDGKAVDPMKYLPKMEEIQ